MGLGRVCCFSFHLSLISAVSDRLTPPPESRQDQAGGLISGRPELINESPVLMILTGVDRRTDPQLPPASRHQDLGVDGAEAGVPGHCLSSRPRLLAQPASPGTVEHQPADSGDHL